VAFVSFAAHNFSAAGRSKALCGCFASFEFWHGLVLFGHKLQLYHVCGTFGKRDLDVGIWGEGLWLSWGENLTIFRFNGFDIT
jgi:hypothetical protein